MAGLNQARGLARRPLVVVMILVAVSLIAAARPAPATTTAPPIADPERVAAGPAAEASAPSGAGRAQRAPIVDIIPGHAAPVRPVVQVPPVEPIVVLGPGAGSAAVFLGDSFTSGWNGAGIGDHGWPRLVGAARGWQTVNLAVAGSGFVNPGWTNQPIGALVASAVRHDPDVIVLAGGHNDSRSSVSATARAADDVIDRLRASAPDALLVVVAPIWQDGNPPRRCLVLRDRLRDKAAAVGAVFIDPLADGWFSGNAHRLIGPDGLHPNDAGHRLIADRVLAVLGR
jgi:lysophospholipase L1-like esterase